MTDNRTRTVADVRHLFDKYGGNLGQTGSVAWMFKKVGIVNVLKADADEDRLMEVALEAGASDVRDDGELWTVECDPNDLPTVQDAIVGAGIAVADAEVDNIPETRVALEGHKAESMVKLINGLEDLDDVQNVFGNHDLPDDLE